MDLRCQTQITSIEYEKRLKEMAAVFMTTELHILYTVHNILIMKIMSNQNLMFSCVLWISSMNLQGKVEFRMSISIGVMTRLSSAVGI